MKTIFLTKQVCSVMAVCSLLGCASGQQKAGDVKDAKTTEPPAAEKPSAQDAALKEAESKPSEPFEGDGWQSMFDGSSLKGWAETQFAGRGEVQCKSGLLVLNMGDPFTGINYTNAFPTINYEIALDAMRISGSDFFCGLTVPVGTNFCSLIVGGWGGTLVGISSLDGMDASENETTKFIGFDTGHWYRIRLRITDAKIQAWIDKDKLVDVETKDRKVSVRAGDIEMSEPLGIAAWQTTSAFRQIKWRAVPQGK
jgi:hypothetical protein